MQFDSVTSYHAHPLLLEAFAERVRAASPRADETVVFTAHSLPVRIIEGGDVYAQEVATTARGVAERAGVGRFDIAYQSAGRTPEPWIGPDLTELIASRAARDAGATLRRTESLNTSPTFVAALAEIVRARL